MDACRAELLARIASRFEEGPIRAYLVGGVVRDLLLGREPRDLDLLLESPADDEEEGLRCLAKLAGMDPVAFDRREPVTYRVVSEGTIVDVSFCPPGGLRPALERRDFTFNAMALPLREAVPGKSGTVEVDPAAIRALLIDPLGGLADLDGKRIAAAGPLALAEDPLRMLRGIRLEATLPGFRMSGDLLAEIRIHAARIRDSAAERISLEMEAILVSPRAGAALRRMDEGNLLSPILPEMDPMRGLAQPARYHDHDVFEHTLRAVEHADVLAEGCPGAGLPPLEAEEALVLKWAALLHDAGKPATCSVDEHGIPHFYGHESISSELAESALRRLRVPARTGQAVAAIVAMHLRLGSLAASATGDRPLKRLLRAAGDLFVPLALLSVADRRAAGGAESERLEAALFATIRRAMDLRDDVATIAKARPLLRGEDVMRILNVPPGPRVGSILSWLERLRLEGRIATKEEAAAILEALPPPRVED